MKVRIVDIARNDLGQVMIFGDSAEGRSVFVKSFYKPGKSQKSIHVETGKYMKSLAKLKGKNVTVIYRQDDIGNLEVSDIR